MATGVLIYFNNTVNLNKTYLEKNQYSYEWNEKLMFTIKFAGGIVFC